MGAKARKVRFALNFKDDLHDSAVLQKVKTYYGSNYTFPPENSIFFGIHVVMRSLPTWLREFASRREGNRLYFF